MVQELKESLIQLNFQMSPLDPWLFSLPDGNGKLHGLIGIHVDDGLCIGDHVFTETLKRLEARFPFGSKRETDFVFTGIHIHQDESYNIQLDQKDYVCNIEPISIDRSRRKLEQEMVREPERQGLRALIGWLQCAASTPVLMFQPALVSCNPESIVQRSMIYLKPIDFWVMPRSMLM